MGAFELEASAPETFSLPSVPPAISSSGRPIALEPPLAPESPGAGGGMATGQVLGATNRYGEYVTERPVSFQEIFATFYHHLGIDIQSATVTDLNGRPQYLLDSGVRPINELS